MSRTIDTPRTVSGAASAVLEEAAARKRRTIRLPEDKEWLEAFAKHPAQLLSDMTSKRLLYRVARGRYVIAPRASFTVEQAAPTELLVDLLFGPRPYYVSHLSALIAHRLTDIHSTEFYVALPAQRPVPDVELPGRQLHVVHVSPARWPMDIGGEIERVRAFSDGKEFWWRSTLERTVVDAVLRPELSGGFETVVTAWARAHIEHRADWVMVAQIAKRLGSSAERRVAFLLDMLGVRGSTGWFDDLEGRLTSVLLDRSRPVTDKSQLQRDSRTGVLVNIPYDYLQGWMSGEAMG